MTVTTGRTVFDASAVLALLLREPGHEAAAELRRGGAAAVSSVNLSEVIAKLSEKGMPDVVIREALDALGFEVVPFDTPRAYRTGRLRLATKAFGLSLGDRACLALGREFACPVVTADRAWGSLSGLNIVIRFIR